MNTSQKIVGGLIIATIIGFAGLVVLPNSGVAAPTLDQYVVGVQRAQMTYEAALVNLCEAEASLAQNKLIAAANGIHIESDLNVLNAKAKKDCVGKTK